MTKPNLTERGYAAVKIVLILIAVAAIGTVGWFVYDHRAAPKKVDTIQTDNPPQTDINASSFQDCAKAGNPIQESFPERCTTKDGRTFTNDKQSAPGSAPGFAVIKEWGVKVPAVNAEYLTYTISGKNSSPYGTADASAEFVLNSKSKPVSEACRKVGITAYKLSAKPTFGDGVKIGDAYYILSIAPTSCSDTSINELRSAMVANLTAVSIEKN